MLFCYILFNSVFWDLFVIFYSGLFYYILLHFLILFSLPVSSHQIPFHSSLIALFLFFSSCLFFFIAFFHSVPLCCSIPSQSLSTRLFSYGLILISFFRLYLILFGYAVLFFFILFCFILLFCSFLFYFLVLIFLYSYY